MSFYGAQISANQVAIVVATHDDITGDFAIADRVNINCCGDISGINIGLKAGFGDSSYVAVIDINFTGIDIHSCR